MATFDDFDGVFFTIQALRLIHPEVMAEASVLVLDNNPGSESGKAVKAFTSGVPKVRYIPFTGYHSTAVRDLLFRESTAEIVLCIDAHVLIRPGGLRALLDYFDVNPRSLDIVQGPLLNDDLETGHGTHFKPGWGGGMYGQWAIDDRYEGPDAEPFEIPMQGLGLFACRREAWPGINPRFRGFGGEEGYLHEKFRQRGGRAICLPALGWNHRFSRPAGAPYPNRWQDRLRNYHVGWSEVGWDTSEVDEYFRELLQPDEIEAALSLTRRQLDSPLIRFDGIISVTSPEQDESSLPAVVQRLATWDSDWRLERFPAVPSDEPGMAILRFRDLIETVRRRAYSSVLALPAGEDPQYADARLAAIAAVADRIGQEPWDLIWVAGGEGPRSVAVNASAFNGLLEQLPSQPGEALDAFLARHQTLEGYLESVVVAGRFRAPSTATASSAASPRVPSAPADPERSDLATGASVAGHALPRAVLSINGFGVSLSLTDTSALGIADQVAAAVAPELISRPSTHADLTYLVQADGSGSLSVTLDARLRYQTASVRDAVRWIRASIDAEIAFRARGVMILHAGVVGWRGRAIVIPGRSGAGKSSLVAALVRSGAVYYSDDYAPIDPDGLVHPYARPISIGAGEADTALVRHIEPPLSGQPFRRPPLPVGMVLLTAFQAGSRWRPQVVSGARGALALLDHVIMTRDQPQRAMAAANLVASSSLVLSGPRPDARRVADDLLARLDDLLDGCARGVIEDRVGQRRPQRRGPVVPHVGQHQ